MPMSPLGSDLPLKERLVVELGRNPGQKATDLANVLGVDRKEVNRCLAYELVGKVQQGSDYRWRLLQKADATPAPADAPQPASEIGRLAKYYLECIGQDMDEGVSAFAQNRHGDPDYAQLSALPMAQPGHDWWNEPGVGRVLGKVREDRAKLTAWLGYPVRLRRHRTPRWEGFFAEPVLLWRIELPDARGDSPTIGDDAPLLNPKFLRSFMMGDGIQLAEESARLAEELGLNVPAADLPDPDDLVDRLVRIRPDWDWRETLAPSDCTEGPSLSSAAEGGIYNRAIVIPGERSPFTQGLETELKTMTGLSDAQVAPTALGQWLAGGLSGDGVDATADSTVLDDEPLIEVLPMNSEQRAAVRAALSSQHTVVTGPPGTGKSQVVTNLLVNAAWRGMKVLFASKNNKAVDVVEARVNGLGNRPVLLRLGAKEYQAKLAAYLTQLLAGNPAPDDQLSYDEGLERHRSLAARMAQLDAVQQRTLEARNAVDRLDAEAEDARVMFGPAFGRIDAALLERAMAACADLQNHVQAAARDEQGMVVRIAWSMLKTGRMTALRQSLQRAAETAAVMGVGLPDAVHDDNLRPVREAVSNWQQRLAAAKKVVTYKAELQVLQSSPSFEQIAQQRYTLTQHISQNSARLWRDWVQLAPTRLTAAQRKDVSDYAAVLQLITAPDAEKVHPSVRQRAKALQSKVTALFSCWAVTSLSARGRVPLEPGFFDLVVIDEASQCDIASALPMVYRAKRSVVIGDPMQLRHISALSRPRDSEMQHKHGLVDNRVGWMYSVSSLYDVAASVVRRENIVNLRDHHRSHSDIIAFSNQTFYEGRLRVATRYQQLKRPRVDQPGVVWQNLQGEATRPSSGGAVNRREAAGLVDALVDLLVRRGYKGTVGVVTPFRAQAQLLQEMTQARKELDGYKEKCELLVDTVHRFQGDERDVMFFSPVVATGISAGALGYLRSNGNLFNVAITRARGLLHVVGDRQAATDCGVDYLANFATYVAGLDATRPRPVAPEAPPAGGAYPSVARPEQVSDWERVLYKAMVAAGLRPIPQYSVDQYDLDFALVVGDRRLDVEVDGERYHRSWTGELCLRDQLRNQRLIELGWEVKRFWVYEVRDQLDDCVRKLCDWVSSAKGMGSVSPTIADTSSGATNR